MKPNNETALGAAFKSAFQSLSKKKQVDHIADLVYKKFDVFRRFQPLALGIHDSLITSFPQFDTPLVARVVANHCRKMRYVRSLARGGKRFDLAGKPVGQVTEEEKRAAQKLLDSKAAIAKPKEEQPPVLADE